MNNKIMISAFSLGVTLITGTGCKKFLDVNENTNVARNPEVSQVLPSTQVYIASAMSVNMGVNGGIWAQYWTQSPVASQYKTIEQYLPSASSYDNGWGLFTNDALTDLKVVENIARSKNLKQYVAVSKYLQAYTFQVMTDAWGDIPFSQAIKGADEDGGIISPAYDKQEQVYNGVLALIDSALALTDLQDNNHPGSDDLIYGGDMSLWQKFGYTLKLKMLLRLSEVNPSKAQTGIVALYADPDVAFIGSGEDALISFSATPGNQNPLFSEEVALNSTQNLVASKTVVDSMNANGDDRVFQLFTTVGGNVVGIQQGNYNALASASSPSELTGALAADENSALAPVRLISSYESMLLQAEAIARGWGTGDDQLMFEDAIASNFIAYGLDQTDATSYITNSYWGAYPVGGTVTEKVRHIITQKWFCMTGTQGFEAWTEQRRTGYPDFFTVSVNSLAGAGKFPGRFLYPNTEVTRNQKFPGQKLVVDKVWWDVN